MTTRAKFGSVAGDGRSPESTDSCTQDGVAPSSSRSSPVANSIAGKRPKKRAQVPTACGSCRMAKLKCSGQHPTCQRCRSRGTPCMYDVTVEGLTRREFLRMQYEQQERELEKCTLVMDRLRTGTDTEASALLARLRMGDSIDTLYRRLKDGSELLDGEKPPCHPPWSRPSLSPLDVKFEPGVLDERRMSSIDSAATDGFQIPFDSPSFSVGNSPVLPRQYIEDESLAFPVYRRPFRQEYHDPSFAGPHDGDMFMSDGAAVDGDFHSAPR